MIHEIVQIYATKILYSPKVGSHNQAMSGLWCIPAMNHDWKLFRRPLADSVFQKLEWTQLPGLGEKTLPGTVHTGISGGSCHNLWVCSVCFVKVPHLLLLSFFTFLPSSGLHKIFVHPFSISSALLQVFVLFLLLSHPLYVTNIASAATAYHHLLLIFGFHS